MKVSGFSEDWFIFDRISIFSNTQLTRVKDDAINKSGVRRIKNYCFRHSHAPMLIDSGELSILDVFRRLGHSDSNKYIRTSIR